MQPVINQLMMNIKQPTIITDCSDHKSKALCSLPLGGLQSSLPKALKYFFDQPLPSLPYPLQTFLKSVTGRPSMTYLMTNDTNDDHICDNCDMSQV
jgi:hypothetical protein